MEELGAALRQGAVTVVTGTGVTAALTDRSSVASWPGLIDSGLQQVGILRPSRVGTWSDAVRSLIELGRSGDASSLVNAASMVATELQDIGPQAYAKWLHDTVGTLQIADRSLAVAVGALRAPILTTNYDTLLEEALGRGTAVWTDPVSLQAALAGVTTDIGHLHGAWNAPESVVFGSTDYMNALHNDQLQVLQRGAAALKHLVYIGCGDGLDDPNFSALLRWHRESFPSSQVTHFRLCRDEELDSLNAHHANDNIRLIPYGGHFTDLVPFLENIAPRPELSSLTSTGLVRDRLGEARDSVLEDLRRDSVLAAHVDESRPTASLVVAPVLFPVPHAEFVKLRSEPAADGVIERLDPLRELQEADFLLLVADEGAGLTTALMWMAWTAATDLRDAVPIYVDFVRCPKGDKRPLRQQVRAAARATGAISDRREELPPLVLSIDDLNPYDQPRFDRVVCDLTELKPVITIIGCRQGREHDAMAGLRGAGFQPRVRYIGPLYRNDILELTRAVAPARCEEITSQVIEILQTERLPRNPFTVSLLIAILIGSTSVAAMTSQAVVLDRYVSLMLRMGDVQEDARYTFDVTSRETLLSVLAEYFVYRDAVSLPEGDVVGVLGDAVRQFGWPDAATSVLRDLVELKALRIDQQRVSFARQSFLALFAAKRLPASPALRERLLADPVRYATVLALHAALDRTDRELLTTTHELLVEALALVGEELKGASSPFAVLPQAEPSTWEALDIADEPAEPGAPETRANVAVPTTLDDHFLDSLADERPAFEVVPKDGMGLVERLAATLDLVSRTLRDTDQTTELALKRQILVDVLSGWGLLITSLSADPHFQELVSKMTQELNGLVGHEPGAKSATAILDELARTIPGSIALGGIHATLASRRLLSLISEALDSGELDDSDERAVAAMLLVFAIHEPGWPTQVQAMLQDKPNTWIVQHFVVWLCLTAYFQAEPGRSDHPELETLCVALLTRGNRYRTHAERADHVNRTRQGIRAAALRFRQRHLMSSVVSRGLVPQ